MYCALPTGAIAFDRAVFTIIGYAFLLSLAFLFLRYSRSTMREYAKQVVRDSFKPVVKLAFFLMIDLLIFPFFQGALVCLATLPALQNGFLTGTWVCRALLLWVVGMQSTFYFIDLMDFVRKVVPGGVLWWVPDPRDTYFRDFRERLEEGSMEQMRRICFCGALQATVIIVAGLSYMFMKYALGILPPHWYGEQGWLPFTLICHTLICHIYLLVNLNPRRHLKRRWFYYFFSACTLLRLSSFMLSFRCPDEEGSHVCFRWRARLFRRLKCHRHGFCCC
ncbi:hypothetical protein BT69DRAFT_421589 [Atractiella rhizophila]|nr:hypothetical protein BT69DRAFT_421589 [Atractiella rhizophila]